MRKQNAPLLLPTIFPFSSPEAALLLVSTKDRDLWPDSGQVLHRKSAVHGLPVTLRMLRVKSDKSDWFWSQSGRNKCSRVVVGVIYNSERMLSPSDWLNSLENLLGYLTVYWDGMLMLTRDINIDMLRPSDHLTKRYQGILDMFELAQIVEQPTRITRTSKTLIDHFITNHPQKVTNTGIIPCSIVSDHDAIYACVNVRLPRFQPRYKFIRDIRNFKENVFKEDFSTLPLSVISYSDDPDEQLETLNTLISECLERHAPLRKVRVTRPPAPWMKDPLIEELKKKRDATRFTAH